MRFAKTATNEWFSTFVCSTKIESGPAKNHHMGWRYRKVKKHATLPSFNGRYDHGFVEDNTTKAQCNAMR